MDYASELELPDNLADSIAARIQDVDRHSQTLNAYVQGIADSMNIPAGWKFDKDRMVFHNPQKGDDK